jgi:hypothetical protein
MVAGLQEAYDFLGRTNPTVGKTLFDAKPTTYGYQQVQHFNPYGTLPQQRDFGGDIAEASIEQGFGKNYLISMYGLKDVIAQEIIRRDNYGMLTRWCTTRGGALAEIYATHDELLAANYFAAQFSLTTPAPGSPDGVGLFSTSHPLSPQQPNNLQSNRPSTPLPFGMPGLQAARANIEQQLKANGLTRWDNDIDKVVFNPNIEEIVLQCLHSDWVPGTSDRDMNTMKNRNITPVSWKYWTASGATNPFAYNSWFALGKFNFLKWWTLTPVSFDSQKILGINSIMFASFQEQTLGHDAFWGTYGSPAT